MIEIGLCADENFAMPCGVCITSIFESNKNSKIRIHILTNGFSDHSIQLLNQTAKKYNQIIDVYKIDSLVLQGLSIMEGRYPIMIYARLLFPQILDKNISKLIYLDCDIIVVDSITELWNTPFNNKVCLAVTAGNADDMTRLNRINTYSHTYVNSGVIFMNL